MPYTTLQVATLANMSRATVRLYAGKYREWFSPGAQVASGAQRNFALEDVKVLRFVLERTQSGVTHAQVLAELQAGALAAFDWAPPEPPAPPPPPPPPVVEVEEDETAAEYALVPVAQLRAALTLLEDARQREETANTETAQLREQVAQLQHELGRAQGQLAERRLYRAPAWVRSLFGGRE